MEKLTFESLRKKKAFAIAGIGITALTLSGCGQSLETETKSTVISHEYDDPDWYFVGKILMHDREHYLLNLEQCGYDPEEYGVGEDGCITESFEVTQETYEAIPDGVAIVLHEDDNGTVTIEELPR